MTPDPRWTTLLSALLTPAVAVLGIFIAYRQWRLAQEKLKLDLFDKRFKVYEAARELLASIMTSGKAKDEEVMKFLIATRAAKWLLKRPVADYLNEQLYRKAIDLQRLAAEVEGVGFGKVRTNNILRKREIILWFEAQYEVLDNHFYTCLQLQH